MKRTLTALTAILFGSALAMPVLAQDSMSDTPSSSMSTTRESTHTEDYRANEPARVPNTVEHSEREYKSESERSSDVGAPSEETRSEHKMTSKTTTEAVPPPPVDQSSTTTTTHRTTTGY